jgi:hypothetical protein
MKTTIRLTLTLLVMLARPAFAADPLPSWNDTVPKKAIVAFVEKVTTPGSPAVSMKPRSAAGPW